MSKCGSIRWLSILPICILALPFSDASGQLRNESRESIARDAIKLPEAQLKRIQASPKNATFSGSGTGYGSGLRDGRENNYLSPSAIRVLMVGDSLTVGGFGEAMQSYFLKRFGINRFALYASCGSSPEHWMRSGPSFITKCGYRQQTPSSSILYDFQNGRPPQEVATPKLEDLIAMFHPATMLR